MRKNYEKQSCRDQGERRRRRGRKCCRHQSRHSPAAHEETLVRQVVPLQRMESPCWRRLLVGAATHGKELAEKVFCQKLWPMRDPLGSSVFLKDYTPWERPQIGAGEKLEADTECYGLTAATIPHPQCAAWDGEGGR